MINSKTPLKESSELNTISYNQTLAQIKADSLYHSKINIYECSATGTSLTPTFEDKTNFSAFILKYFNLVYKDPAITKNEKDILDYTTLYVIYLWDKSPEHKKILLKDNVTHFGISTMVKNITYKSNQITLNGVVFQSRTFINHYDLSFYSTLEIN